MSRVSLFIVLVLSGGLFAAACLKDAGRPDGGTGQGWVHLETDEKIFVGGYEVYLKQERDATTNLFIKRVPREPYFFITKEIRSAADILLSQSRQYLLINAPCSRIARCVFIADAYQTRGWVISQQARSAHKELAPDPGNAQPASERLDPAGVAFSPDETKVLLKMVRAEGPAGSDLTGPWMFVVDVTDGRVLSEFRKEALPQRWWEVEEEEEKDYIGGG